MTTLGKYELHDELGRGGFAVVYRALDTRLNREVAVKVLNASLSEDPRFVQQFLREAQTAANLKHQNIVILYEADEAGGRLFLAMQLLAGLDLRRRIERDGPLPFPLVVSVIEQIASALAYAHGRGLVHRDVKSANIILDDTGHATLTDFGLVRAVEGSTHGSSLSLSGGFAGTVEYMAPELVEGQKATAASDLYALGIVTYEMVTGRVPFKADTPIAVAFMHASQPPSDPRGLRPELPDGMRTAILMELAKKPVDRQADAAAFARELHQGLEAAESRRPTAVGSGQPATATAAESERDGGARQPVGAAGGRPARLGGRWLVVSLIAAGLIGAMVVVVVLGLLISDLTASHNLAATQAALISNFATASAPAPTASLPSPTSYTEPRRTPAIIVGSPVTTSITQPASTASSSPTLYLTSVQDNNGIMATQQAQCEWLRSTFAQSPEEVRKRFGFPDDTTVNFIYELCPSIANAFAFKAKTPVELQVPPGGCIDSWAGFTKYFGDYGTPVPDGAGGWRVYKGTVQAPEMTYRVAGCS